MSSVEAPLQLLLEGAQKSVGRSVGMTSRASDMCNQNSDVLIGAVFEVLVLLVFVRN